MLLDARVQVARTFRAQVAYGAVDQLEAGLDGAAAYVGQLGSLPPSPSTCASAPNDR